MMLALLEELTSKGIRIRPDGDRLAIRAPKGSLSPELREALAQYKTEILEMLHHESGSGRTSKIEPVSRDQSLPLSFAQERLWVLNQVQGPSAAYSIPAAIRMRGQFRIDLMQEAMGEVVCRHESLRTRFPSQDGVPRQEILEQMEVPLRQVDLRSHSPREIQETINGEIQHVFDLEVGPLFRITVIRVHDDEQIVVMNMHHIISDAWSMRVLIREASTLYQGLLSGQPAELPPLSIQYADYAHWQRKRLQGEFLERSVSAVRERLGGASPLLNVPTDRPYPAVRTQRGEVLRTHLSAALRDQLVELGKEHDATLFMVLTAVYALLLNRHSGQTDICIGIPIANRARPETSPLIGFFANSLVLRVDMSGDPTFEVLLQRVRVAALKTYEQEDLPFERLVEALNPARDTAHAPLFQTMFSVQEAPMVNLSMPGVEIEILPIDNGTAKFDLTVLIEDSPEGLDVPWEFNADLFDEDTVARMAKRFVVLIESVLARPQNRIAMLDILPLAERNTLTLCNQTRGEYPRDATLAQLFARQVERDPEAIAVRFGDEELSYGELNTRAHQLSVRLAEAGVGPAMPVAILHYRGPDLIVGILAILQAGAVYVTLDDRAPTARLKLMTDDCGIRVVVTETSLAGRLPASLTCVFVSDSNVHERVVSGVTPSADWRDTRATDAACIFYTSGSTGQPKGVVVPHRAIVRLVFEQHELLDFGPDECFAQFSNAAFDAFTFELWGALLHGACLVGVPQSLLLEPEGLGEHLRNEKITAGFLTVSLFNQVVAVDPCAFSDMQTLLVGGEALDATSIRRILAHAPPAKLLNGYGPTESATFATTYLIDKLADNASSVPIGKALANTRTYVLDDQLELTPIGVIGELYIGGDGLAIGYHNRPELTAERFLPDPYDDRDGARMYRTGDRVVRDATGILHFIGRLDQQVKVRGFRIELGEIQSVLNTHEAVEQAQVVAHRVAAGHLRLVCYVLPTSPPHFDEAVLREFLLQRLPDYMVPAQWVVLEELPLNANGKIDLNRLPNPLRVVASSRDDSQSGEISSKAQEVLADVWQEVLGVETVGPHDNFFELGGDSILTIQIVARARRRQIHITAAQIFQYQNVAQLAAVAIPAPFISAEQGAVKGPVAITPIQAWWLERGVPTPGHFNQSVLIRIRSDVNVKRLESALTRVVSRHDALRLRYHATEEGGIEQVHGDCGPMAKMVQVDLGEVHTSERAARIERESTTVQRSLDLASGPLVRAALFQLGHEEPARLLIVAHHLVVDGVSWRILLEDLEQAYEDLGSEPSVGPSPKTTSFQAWSKRLHEYSGSEELAQELPLWKSMVDRAPCPRLASPSEPKAESAVLIRSIDLAQTAALLVEPNRAYGMRVNEFLLAVLATTLAKDTGQSTVTIDVESHGREAFFEDIDLSRTVGWFTALWPMTFEIDSDKESDLGEVLLSVKDQLRAVPHSGIGWGVLRYLSKDPAIKKELALPTPEVAFNYLGHIAGGKRTGLLIDLASESAGPDHAPDTPQAHRVEVEARIVEDALELRWIGERSEIETLAEGFFDNLEAQLAHCATPQIGGYSPSDFPDVDLQPDTLGLLASKLEGRSIELYGSQRNLETLTPLTPAQQGILFESLGTREKGLHVEQLSWRLEGELDASAFERSWDAVICRRDVMRSGFFWEFEGEPIQFTLRNIAVPLQHVDLRALACDERLAESERLLAEDREQGFDLGLPPLMRLRLERHAEDEYLFVWTFHHIMLDGWSLPLIAREVFETYEALRRGADPKVAPVRPYQDFVRWIRSQSVAEARDFWFGRLGALQGPTALGKAAGLGVQRSDDRVGVGEAEGQLSEKLSSKLSALAAQQGVTLATVVQGLWALCLCRFSGDENVVFGTTVSGRPPQIVGVESMVGLFMSTIPVYMEVPAEGDVWDWLVRMQAMRSEERSFEYCSAGQVHQWSQWRGDVSLFDSIVVFENYPDASFASGDLNVHMGQRGVRSVGAHTRYALTLIVLPGAQLQIRAIHQRQRLDDDAVSQIVDQLLTLAGLLVHTSDLACLLASVPDSAIPVVHKAALPQSTRSAPVVQTQTHIALAAIWCSLLDLESVGMDENFFLCGGHSLMALTLVKRVREEFAVEIPLHHIFQTPTIAGLAAFINDLGAAESLRTPLPPLLTELRAGDDGPALFLACPGAGTPVCYMALALGLKSPHPVYGFQSPGLLGGEPCLSDVEDMALRFAASIRAVQPQGPYRLGGWSFGAMLAWETAVVLESQGHEVALLALFDAGVTDARRELGRFRRKLQDLSTVAHNMTSIGLPTNWKSIRLIGQMGGVGLPESWRETSRAHWRQARRSVSTFRNNVNAGFQYTARPVQAPIVLFRAKESVGSHVDPIAKELKTLTEGGLEVVVSEGGHMSMILQPALAQDLAQKLDSVLETLTTPTGTRTRET